MDKANINIILAFTCDDRREELDKRSGVLPVMADHLHQRAHMFGFQAPRDVCVVHADLKHT